MIIFIVFIMFILLIIAFSSLNNNSINKEKNNNNIYNLDSYIKKDYVMTLTELIFYRNLKNITDKLELTIFSQVNLERIIKVKDNNVKDRNRIKSRSIDYTIVNNKNCKIICCIELDDYTHKYNKRIERDNFINQLFNKTGIKLYRIQVSNNYNLEYIESILKESI